MKILFFHYGSEDWLGLGSLSSVLKRAGHETDLLLYPHLDLYIKIPFLNQNTIKNRLIEKARNFGPDLIAFTATTYAYKYAKKMAAEFKKIFNVIQIIGGIHATILPEHILQTGDFDIACIGEGEGALLELVTRLEEDRDIIDIENLWIKKNSTIVKNPIRPLIKDLDTIPFSDKEIFQPYGIFTTHYNILTSRGCPHKCSYCCNHIYQEIYRGKGKYVRRRSVDNVIEELKINKSKMGFKHVYFWDDTFCTNKKWLKDFSHRYREEIKLPFHCLTRPEDINEETIESIRYAGCSHINMGIESGSETIRKNVLNRHMSNERIIRATSLIKDSGIKINTFNMFAIPDEGPQEMWETINLNEIINPDGVFAFLLTPLPGTDIANYARNAGTMTAEQAENMKEGIFSGLQSASSDVNLDHPNKNLAVAMKTYLPILIHSPRWLKKYIRKKITSKVTIKVNPFIHMISILYSDKSRIISRATEFWNLLWYYLIKSKFKGINKRGVGEFIPRLILGFFKLFHLFGMR